MRRLIKLDKDYSIKVKSKSSTFLEPDYIYIPIINKRVTNKKRIQKGELVFENIYSSVSGIMQGVEKCILANGSTVSCLKIANDFQEKTDAKGIRKKIANFTKDELLSNLYEESLRKRLEQDNISTILISGIDDEPYIANESIIQKENIKSILETIDALVHIYKAEKAIIAIKNVDSENISLYYDFLGTYQSIELRLVEDEYLIGQDPFLAQHFHLKDSYLYFKTSEIYSLYLNIKKRKAKAEKYVTISGNGINNPQVILVKLGTKAIDLYKYFYEENYEDKDFYVNGLMRGNKMNIQDMIITNDFEGLIVTKKEKIKVYDCIKCGKCISVCPIKSNPMLAYKNNKKIKCIECGLCSYICPSNIPLDKYIRRNAK